MFENNWSSAYKADYLASLEQCDKVGNFWLMTERQTGIGFVTQLFVKSKVLGVVVRQTANGDHFDR